MSFWGATVITNLFSAVPLIGKTAVQWLWGGFSVDNATLNRFYSFHYLTPFLIVSLVGVHLSLLHKDGSTGSTGYTTKETENLHFYPYFYVKDLVAFLFLIIPFSLVLFFAPNLPGHPDNYILANLLSTPFTLYLNGIFYLFMQYYAQYLIS